MATSPTENQRVIRPATGGGVLLDERTFQLEDVDQLTRALIEKSEGRLEKLQSATRQIEERLREQTEETKARIDKALSLAERQIETRLEETARKSAEILQRRYREGHEQGHAAGLAKGTTDGFEKGYSEGLEKGLKEGREDGRRFGEESARSEIKARFDDASQHAVRTLTALREKLDPEWQRAVETARHELLDLALDLARRIVGHEVERAPQFVADVCRDSLDRVHATPPVRVTIHPDDREFIDSWIDGWASTTLGGGSVELVDDASVGRGGCVVTSGSGRADATVAGRLRALGDQIEDAGGIG